MHISRYIFSLFRKNKLRYLVCILGFSAALGSVFAITTYTNQFRSSIEQFFMVDSSSMIVMSRGSSILQIVPYTSILPENLSSDFEEIPEINKIIPLIFKDYSNSSSISLFKKILTGIDFNFLEFYIPNNDLQEGRIPIAGAHEVLIGSDVGKAVGEKIWIANEPFTVSGVLKPDTQFFNQFIYCEYHSVSQLYNMTGYCTIFYLFGDMDTPAKMEHVSDQVVLISDKIQVINSQTMKESTGNFFNMIDLIQVVLAIFPLMISILFVFVLLMLNVKDQQKEFAVMRAMGTSAGFIGLVVFGQTIMMTLLSFLGSMVIAFILFYYSFYIATDLVTSYSNPWDFARYMNEQIPEYLYWEIFGLSVAVGSLVSIIPIFIAMRFNIVKAIREEG